MPINASHVKSKKKTRQSREGREQCAEKIIQLIIIHSNVTQSVSKPLHQCDTQAGQDMPHNIHKGKERERERPENETG